MGEIRLDIIIGIAILLIVFSSTSIVEKRLKSIENQNNQIIKILEEIRDKS